MNNYIRAWRLHFGQSLQAVADAINTDKTQLSKLERGDRRMTLEWMQRLAKHWRVAPEDLLHAPGEAERPRIAASGGTLPIRAVPVTGAVAAGVWREQVDDLGEAPETIPVSLPGLERATLFAMRVEGQSMNQFYPDGSLVICCPSQEMGPRHGDHVIVERRENSLVERSIKELVIETGKARLVPRSSDKRYQAAIDLPRDIHAQNGVAIVAVVVASYMTRVRKPGPALE